MPRSPADPTLNGTTYRCRITLPDEMWARLRRLAEVRGLSGVRLLSLIIRDYAREIPPEETVPLPDPSDAPELGPEPDEMPGPIRRLKVQTIVGPKEMP